MLLLLLLLLERPPKHRHNRPRNSSSNRCGCRTTVIGRSFPLPSICTTAALPLLAERRLAAPRLASNPSSPIIPTPYLHTHLLSSAKRQTRCEQAPRAVVRAPSCLNDPAMMGTSFSRSSAAAAGEEAGQGQPPGESSSSSSSLVLPAQYNPSSPARPSRPPTPFRLLCCRGRLCTS